MAQGMRALQLNLEALGFIFILRLTNFEKEKYGISLRSPILWSLVLELDSVNTNCDQFGLRGVF